jgi:hypothetical protein
MALEPITVEAFARLPKWVRDHINWRNNRIEALEREVTIMRGKYPVSPTSINLTSMDPNVSLPSWVALELHDPNSRKSSALAANLDRYQWEQHKRIAMVVRTTGGVSIDVRPIASNVVHITEGRD